MLAKSPAYATRKSGSGQAKPGLGQDGLDHHSDHHSSREVIGPHSGPYGSRPDRRIHYADPAPLAEVMIKARRAIGCASVFITVPLPMSYEVDRVCYDDAVIATHPANQPEVGGQQPVRPGRDGTGDVQRVHRLDAARSDWSAVIIRRTTGQDRAKSGEFAKFGLRSEPCWVGGAPRRLVIIAPAPRVPLNESAPRRHGKRPGPQRTQPQSTRHP